MRSSIRVTRVFTFYFILVNLYSKTDFCVGFVGATRSISNSNINSDGNDESFKSAPPHSTLNSVGLLSYSAKSNYTQQMSALSKTHHVRHKHHLETGRHRIETMRTDRLFEKNLKPVSMKTGRHRGPSRHQSNREYPVHAVSMRNSVKYEKKTVPSHSRPGAFEAVSHKENVSQNRPEQHKFRNPPITKGTVLENRLEIPNLLKVRNEESEEHLTVKSVEFIDKQLLKKRNNKQYSRNYFEVLLNNYKAHSPYFKRDDASEETSDMISNSLESDEYDDDDEYYDEDYEYDENETQGDAGYGTSKTSVSFDVISEPASTIRSVFYSTKGSSNTINILDKISYDYTTEGKIVLKELKSPDAKRLASQHSAKVLREGTCFIPKPKMIMASNDPSKLYTPHCTILHRCGDDVGCCLPTQTCVSSKNATVELYFFVDSVGSPRRSIERLSFINHTECTCMSRQEAYDWKPLPIPAIPPTMSNLACNCPSLFQRVIDNDNRCQCDCSSSDTQCDQFKRGLEHFSMENRKCIKDGRCNEPKCEYGHYNMSKGKCPTHEDRLTIAYKSFP